MVATELLSRLGIELDIAWNGREAVEMARAAPERYAAVLMDMQMPELDGLGATRALRADPRFARVPIIAMTANAKKADLDACLAAGMNDHVTQRGSSFCLLVSGNGRSPLGEPTTTRHPSRELAGSIPANSWLPVSGVMA